MKLNNDCIRDILIAIESLEYDSWYTMEKLDESLPYYSYDELQYHCVQLLDAELIEAQTIQMLGKISPQIRCITDLTYSGHQFLADIRSDTNWNKTKEIAKNVGSESLHALKDIAVAVVTSAIHNRLGLS